MTYPQWGRLHSIAAAEGCDTMTVTGPSTVSATRDASMVERHLLEFQLLVSHYFALACLRLPPVPSSARLPQGLTSLGHSPDQEAWRASRSGQAWVRV